MMETRARPGFIWFMCLLSLLLSENRIAAGRLYVGQISPGVRVTQVQCLDNGGLFLFSNNSIFAFGFTSSEDVSFFRLVVLHRSSSRIIWTANRGFAVKNSDKFVFDDDGNVYLEGGGGKVWSIDTSNQRVIAMVLQDSGNLVVTGNDNRPLWQSFSHPTDTLLSDQLLFEGMRLVSNPSSNNLSFYLEIKSGDLILYAGLRSSQTYWSMRKETRAIINNVNGNIYSASLFSNSWMMYDKDRVLLQQLILTNPTDSNVTWAAVLGSDGVISFYNLRDTESSINAERTKIPQESCRTLGSCDPYHICSGDNGCYCPSALSTYPGCTLGLVSVSPCNGSTELVSLGNSLGYSAVQFAKPFSNSDLKGCKDACLMNCSCVALFFENRSGKCFLFDQMGSLQQLNKNSAMFASYIKLSSNIEEKHGRSNQKRLKHGRSNQKRLTLIVVAAVLTVFTIIGMICLGFLYCWKKKRMQMPLKDIFREDDLFPSLPGMPKRFGYEELKTATENFSKKLGKGGFGSVYWGQLPDGTQVAVKKLEGISQGNKEFIAEVSSIGSIRHVHLVKLTGLCTEGIHRLLVYEYMANGSLDKWIFTKNDDGFMLDWGRRFNIVLGVAKGLAYVHEDCDVKIIHCDIKPENVLLDDNYEAKVSDFGLAKLMSREESHVLTKVRGTRGYLAPEWIMNRAISAKSDVYSFGVVLLEIIGGRRNFSPVERPEKALLISYAFRMMEEGKPREIIDPWLMVEAEDERIVNAIKVALWCIQGDMNLRPSMNQVVKMLEGSFHVSQPPTSQSCLYPSFFNLINKEATSPGQLHGNSNAYFSVELSGPR